MYFIELFFNLETFVVIHNKQLVSKLFEIFFLFFHRGVRRKFHKLQTFFLF